MLSQVKNLMQGKRGIITGIANEKSMAYSIAEHIVAQGGEVAITYQGEALLSRAEKAAKHLNTDFLLECDVKNESLMDNLFMQVSEKWGKIDFILHAIAFADRKELQGKYLNTSRENFTNSMEVSCYSFTDLCRRAEPLMSEGGSILTLTYYGSQKVIDNYNVMGVAKAALETSVKYLARDLGEKNIRVNALSPGPVKTLAASGISGFSTMLTNHREKAPLKRNTTHNDLANSALYLLSDLSSGVTGETHYVDCGYNIMGI